MPGFGLRTSLTMPVGVTGCLVLSEALMGAVVDGALASGTLGGSVLCIAAAFALIAACFSDRVKSRLVDVLRALRSGK